MSNHMLIGLGGTGGRMLAEFRKAMFRDGHRNLSELRETARTPAQRDMRFGYLYVDASDTDLNQNRANWEVFGRSVQLDENQKLLIRQAGVGTFLDNIQNQPAIGNWLGNVDDLKEIFRHANMVEGAGQIRRRGRYLFAHSARAFKDRLVQNINRLEANGVMRGVTFHVCCTLAAGTGSGSFIDTLSIIRRTYPNANDYPIYFYGLVTDSEVGDVNMGNFYANQYAALKELNAFALNDFNPHDVTASGERLTTMRDRMHSCYLITDRNANGIGCDRASEERLVGEFIYNAHVAFRGYLGEHSRAITMEDGAQYVGGRGHFYKNASMGVKRWGIPSTEIREKIGYALGADALWQMLYLNWDDSLGWRDQRRSRVEIPNALENLETEPQWLLDDDSALDRHPEGVSSWQQEWERVFRSVLEEARQSNRPQPSWLAYLEDKLKEHYDLHFRDAGVSRFYSEKLENVRSAADDVGRKVEQELYDAWKISSYGLEDVADILGKLSAKLESRIQRISEDEQSLEEQIAGFEKRLPAIKTSWNKGGLFFNKRKSVIEDLKRRLPQYYVNRTHLVAMTYKQAYLSHSKARIDELMRAAQNAASQFSKMGRNRKEAADSRCRDGQARQFEQSMVREYNPAEIETFLTHMRADKQRANSSAQQVRSAVNDALTPYGNERSFALLWKACEDGVVESTVDQECFPLIDAIHSHVVERNRNAGVRPILHLSIIDALRVRYENSSELLRQHVTSFMQSAATAFQLDTEEVQPNVYERNAAMPDMPLCSMLVFMPDFGARENEFTARLVERFSAAPNVVVLDSPRSDEITVLATQRLMPFRMFKALKRLKEKYETRLAANRKAACMEVHLEDFAPTDLMDLMLPPKEEAAQKAPMLAFLGETMGWIEEYPFDDKNCPAFVEREASGRLAKTPDKIVDSHTDLARMPLHQVEDMESKILKLLKEWKGVKPRDSAIREIEAKFEGILTQVYEVCKTDVGKIDADRDPRFVKALKSVDEVKKYIKEVLK